MSITVDASSLEARYGGAAPPQAPKDEELYYPGSGKPPPGSRQGQIPQGIPVPEGQIVQQIVGRGQPSIMVVPPKQEGGPPAPQIAVMPPQPSSRTTIGTIIEGSPPVSPTTSNPLTSSPAPVPSGTTAASPAEPAKAPRKKVDLALEILNHIQELGGQDSEAAQKFYDRSPGALKLWHKNPGSITLESINRFLAKRPGVMVQIAEELEPHFKIHENGTGIQSLPNRGKLSVMVCSPVLGQPTLPFLWDLVYLAKKYEIGFDIQADTMIARSRNMLAKRFLESNATWSLWIDADMAAPIANGDWFKWLTGASALTEEQCHYDVLNRLLGHTKAIVGGVYASRRWHGQLVIQPEIRPRSHEDKLLCNEIRRGTARGLVDVDWIGFGCALVHRQVFLEVQRRFPDLAPRAEFAPWRFFQPLGDEGEDEAFCQRVKACSIPIWLDTQLVCAHVGNMAFMPEHTLPRPGI